jgi:hypothetical protein
MDRKKYNNTGVKYGAIFTAAIYLTLVVVMYKYLQKSNPSEALKTAKLHENKSRYDLNCVDAT